MCLFLSHTPSQDQQTTAGKVMLMGLSLDVHFRRGYLPLCHQHSAFFTDRVRGARTCRHPCSAFSSDRIRGSNTCWYPHMTNQLRVAPAPAVFYAAPAPVIECSALYKIGQEHKHSYIWKRRRKRSHACDVMDTFFLLSLSDPFRFQNYQTCKFFQF